MIAPLSSVVNRVTDPVAGATRRSTPSGASSNGQRNEAGQADSDSKRNSDDGEARRQNKRYKQTMDSVADEYICPITRELPIDPVTAEDGMIYERSAIESVIRLNGPATKSPATNRPMGPHLLPAYQVRNAIEKLVKSGAIGGLKAERWMERLEDEKKLEGIRLRAEGGDVEAMYELGDAYNFGRMGLAVDQYSAFLMYKSASDRGDIRAMARTGEYLSIFRGCIPCNFTLGAHLLTKAAEQGSDVAQYCLGYLFENGLNGLPQDVGQAKKYYGEVTLGKSKFKHLDKFLVESAESRLRAIRDAGL